MNRLAAAPPTLALSLLLACGADPGAQVGELPVDDPIERVRAVDARLADGDLTVLWDLLPEAHREDVDRLIDLFAENMDPALWSSIVGLVGSTAELLEVKEELILESAHTAALEDDEPFDEDLWAAAVVHAARRLRAFERSRYVELEYLLDDSGRELLALGAGGPGGFVWPLDDEQPRFVAEAGASGPLDVVALERGPDRARLQLRRGDVEVEQEWSRVDGQWLPRSFAESFDAEVERLEADLVGMFEGERATLRADGIQLVATADGIVRSLQVATTVEEFRDGFQGGMMRLLGAFLATGLRNLGQR